jgi:SAM-dependent methyltransferase
VESVRSLEGCTVLEYGCGNGAATAAFAPRTARYIGLDISDTDVADARRILAEGDLHPTLVSAPPDRILDEVAELAGEVDVFLCYAVLEHMHLDERLELLRLSRRVVRDDGIVVIIETPNRLTPWDYHTSQLPFLNQLPEELALRYLDRSPRPEFLEAMQAAADDGPAALREAFARWGRGMSFHELELVYDDLPRHVAGSSWEPVLLPEREIHREELALQQVLDRARPDLPASFSRYWLDLILTPLSRPALHPALRPWTLSTIGGTAAFHDGDHVAYLPAADSMLAVDLPCPSGRLVIVVDAPDDGLSARVRTTAGSHTESAFTAGHYSRVAEVRPAEPSDRFELRLSHPGAVRLVAYEA